MYNENNTLKLTLKKKIFLSFLGIISLTLGFFIAASSLTFNFDETGWRTLSNIESQNFFGKYGSYVSGFLFKEFGILTPIVLFLILTLYGFKFVKYQAISNFWFKFILVIGLIVMLGLLSQPLHKLLSTYFIEENRILKYEGLSSEFYKFILDKANNASNFGQTFSATLINIILTLLSILVFIYTASTNINELSFLKKIIAPIYLPLYWIIQLFNNLFIKNFFFILIKKILIRKNKSLYNDFKNILNF